MQPNISQHLNYAQEKVGVLTKFLNPIIIMLEDKNFFGLPLRIFYYLIAVSNLAIPLGTLGFCGLLFKYFSYFPLWAYITIPIFCIIIISLSIIIGVGSFAFWIRRLQDILAYNNYNHNYMALRNFALMQRTFGEWVGLLIMFFGITDLLTFIIPEAVISPLGIDFLNHGIVITICEAIAIIAFGYFIIFIAKMIYDWIESIANNAADTRDIADIERMNIEIEN